MRDKKPDPVREDGVVIPRESPDYSRTGRALPPDPPSYSRPDFPSAEWHDRQQGSDSYPTHKRRASICAYEQDTCDVCIDCQNAFVEYGRAELATLRAEVNAMLAVTHHAVELRGWRAALDKGSADGKSQDFMGQLRERYGLAGRALDRAVDTYRALQGGVDA